MSITDTIEIDAPAEAVWALTTDVARWPELLPTTMTAVDVEPGWLHPGGTARIKQPAQPWRTWTVTELEPHRRFVWEADGFGGRIVAGHTLQARPATSPVGAAGAEAGGPVVNTLSIELTGRLARFRERLFRRPIARALAIENAAFKRHAEAAAAAR